VIRIKPLKKNDPEVLWSTASDPKKDDAHNQDPQTIQNSSEKNHQIPSNQVSLQQPPSLAAQGMRRSDGTKTRYTSTYHGSSLPKNT
jgi:hypothetical protein